MCIAVESLIELLYEPQTLLLADVRCQKGFFVVDFYEVARSEKFTPREFTLRTFIQIFCAQTFFTCLLSVNRGEFALSQQ